jgi:hypothetical protein
MQVDIAGTIGGSTLKRFTVIYDYHGGALFSSRIHYPDPPERTT